MLTRYLLCSAFAAGLCMAPTQGPASEPPFIYQGEVHRDGVALNGEYGMTFDIYAEPDGGSPLESLTGQIQVRDGLFQIEMPVDADIFGNYRLWVEITITDLDDGSTHTLSPRQPMGAAPYAMYALESGTGGDGESVFRLSGSSAYYNAGHVGIGTSSPEARLHIKAGGNEFPFGVESGNTTSLLIYPNSGVSVGGATPPGDSGLNVVGKAAFAAPVYMDAGLTVKERVGVGTNNPSGTLQVSAGSQDQASMVVESSSGSEDLLVWNGGGVTVGGTASTWGGGLTVQGHSILHDQVSIGGFEGPKDDISLQVLDGHAAIGGFSHDDRLGVGTDNPWTPLHVISNADQDPFRAMVGDNSSSATSIRAYGHQGVAIGHSWGNSGVPERGLRVYGPAVIGQFPSGGSTSVCRTSNGTLTACSSSERYKHGIESLDSAPELLARLRAVRFVWTESGQDDIGFVAEEIAEVVPELATFDDDGQVVGVEYARMTAVLAAAMQEHRARSEQRIDRVEAEKAALKQANQRLVARIEQLEQTTEKTRVLAERNAELERRLARMEQLMLGQSQFTASGSGHE